MSHTSEIDDVPASQLNQVVQDFHDAGATSVQTTKQADGNFNVVATFDDGDGGTAAAAAPATPAAPAAPAAPSAPAASAAPSTPAAPAAPAAAAVAGGPSGTVLQRPGIPWTVLVDGNDLVVRNILATCFGGKFDTGDNGKTESGVMNNGFPTADAYPMGVALPIRSTEAATQGSPLAFSGPQIPWMTTVKVWREADGEATAINCILIDNGPKVSQYPDHALDLNPNVVLYFSPKADPRTVANTWSAPGFSYRIVGGAKFVSPYNS